MSIEYMMARIGNEDTFLKSDEAAVKATNIVSEYIAEVVYEDGQDAIDSHSWHIVTPDSFEQDWNDDERLKKTNEIKAKYKNLAKNNRVLFLEVDWN